MEALRAKFAHWEAEAGRDAYGIFHCLGGKSSSQYDLKPFSFVVRPEHCTARPRAHSL